MWRLACVIQVGPKYNHMHPYKRQAEGDYTMREGNVTTSAKRERERFKDATLWALKTDERTMRQGMQAMPL